MAQLVKNIPGIGDVNFPDEMSVEDINKTVQGMLVNPKQYLSDSDAIKPKKGYVEGLKEWATTPTGLGEQIKQQMVTNVAAPTTLGGNEPGSLRDIYGGIPERATRFTLGTLGSGADVLGATVGAVGGGLNALAGGIPGRMMGGAGTAYMNSPVAKGLMKAGSAFANTGAGQGVYNAMTPQNPADAANMNATMSGAKFLTNFMAPEAAVTKAYAPMVNAVKKTTNVPAKVVEKVAAKGAEEISGVPSEVLTKYGWGRSKEAQAIKAASGQEAELGDALVDRIKNFDQYLPERPVINEAVQRMPAVKIDDLVQTLENSKTPGNLKSSKAINSKIDELIQDIEDNAVNGEIPAEKILDIRREMDREVGDQFGKESNDYITALKKGRHEIAASLVTTAEASGNPAYVAAMKSMASKMQKLEKLQRWLGKKTSVQESRSEQFVATLFGKNKADRQKVVQELSDVFGEDFYGASKNAYMAAQLGPKGVPTLLPKQTTGRSLMAPILAGGLAGVPAAVGLPASAGAALIPLAFLASPKLAAPTLGTLRGIVNKTGSKTLPKQSFLNNPSMSGLPNYLVNTGMSNYAINKTSKRSK